MQMRADEKTTLAATPFYKSKPSKVEGVITWKTDKDGIVSLFPSDTGATCDVSGLSEGQVLITAEADADLGGGVRIVTGQYTIVLTVAEADHLEISSTPPVAQ